MQQLDKTKSCPECPENWIMKENHKKESLIISLRGWWNNKRTAQRTEIIEGIIKALRREG